MLVPLYQQGSARIVNIYTLKKQRLWIWSMKYINNYSVKLGMVTLDIG
jgi:hypothetical protein